MTYGSLGSLMGVIDSPINNKSAMGTTMHSVTRLPLVATVLFLLPVTIAAALNWNNVRPYLIADPQTTEGHVLYFFAPL